MPIKSPKVSVFFITYNHEKFVRASLDSLLSQSFQDFEVVIGDDASTDGTKEILMEYQRRYPDKIDLVLNKTNVGVTANSNLILARCRGEYVCFLAGDDIYYPEKLRLQVQAMDRVADSILSYHDIEVFDSDSGSTLRFFNRGPNSYRGEVGGTQLIAKRLVQKGVFMGAVSIMVRRDALPPWLFDDRVRVASDWLMWIDICARNHGKVLFLDEVLARYRKHQGGVSIEPQKNRDDIYVTLGIVEHRYPELRAAAAAHRAYCYYSEAIARVGQGNYREGNRMLVAGVYASRRLYSWKALPWLLYSWFRQVLYFMNS